MEVARELDLALQDLLVDGHRVVVIERVNASDHLVSQDAQGPPVDRLAMALVEEHLGCQVLGRPTQSVSARLAVLGEAEVGQLQVALLINQDVLGLQVAVDYVQRVQILEHKSNLCGVEPKSGGAKKRGRLGTV